MEQTRLRITQAAVELHSTVGPARAGFAQVAELAGVDRATVYRHFADESALFKACSAHFAARNPLPDPERWAEIPDPRDRLRAGLEVVYAYYRRAEGLLANVTRDAEHMPAVRAAGAYRRRWLAQVEEVLARDWPTNSAGVRDAIGLAVDFRTWQILVRRRNLSTADAVGLMVAMVGGAACM